MREGVATSSLVAGEFIGMAKALDPAQPSAIVKDYKSDVHVKTLSMLLSTSAAQQNSSTSFAENHSLEAASAMISQCQRVCRSP